MMTRGEKMRMGFLVSGIKNLVQRPSVGSALPLGPKCQPEDEQQDNDDCD